MAFIRQNRWVCRCVRFAAACCSIFGSGTGRHLSAEFSGHRQCCGDFVVRVCDERVLLSEPRNGKSRAAAVCNILLFHFITGGAACLFLNLYPQFLGNIFNSDEMTRLAPKIGFVIWIWIFSAILETVAIANREPKYATAFIIFAQVGKTALMATGRNFISNRRSISLRGDDSGFGTGDDFVHLFKFAFSPNFGRRLT